MNIEWIINKAKEKFYPVTHAKAVLFGNNNRTVEEEINNINSTYIKGLSASDTTVTYTKGDGTIGTITTKDTTYSNATTSSSGLMSSDDKTKLDGIESGANNYSLPTASSSTLGGVKTTSTVTSTSGLTACPIISGVPYYKECTGGSGEGGITTSNSVLIPVDYTLFTLNEETQRYEQTITVSGMTEGLGGTFDILRSGAILTEQESLIIANITDIVRQNGSIKVICLEQPTTNYTLVLYGTFTQATDETTLIANMNGWFTRVENLESNVNDINSNIIYADTDDEVVVGSYCGKPLYRKRLLYKFASTGGQSSVDVSSLNIDSFVRYFGDAEYDTHKLPFTFSSHDGSCSFAFYQKNDNTIYVRTVLNGSYASSIVTLYIEYTKNTDS